MPPFRGWNLTFEVRKGSYSTPTITPQITIQNCLSNLLTSGRRLKLSLSI